MPSGNKPFHGLMSTQTSVAIPHHWVQWVKCLIVWRKHNTIFAFPDTVVVQVLFENLPNWRQEHIMGYQSKYTPWLFISWWCKAPALTSVTWACVLSLVWGKLRLCSANHRAGYFSKLACDWLSIVWAYSEQETEMGRGSSWILWNHHIRKADYNTTFQLWHHPQITTRNNNIMPWWNRFNFSCKSQ